MGATLYAALVMHSYIMSLLCCAAQARARLGSFAEVFVGSVHAHSRT